MLEAAALQTAFEPTHSLSGATVGECVRYHCAMCLALQAIVSHGAGGVQRRLDVALLDDVLGAVGMIGPDTGEAVRLQFYAYRNRVGPPLLALRALGVRPLQDAELVLHMMADLMGNHIGFGELPGRVEPILHFLEEG